MEEEKGNRKTAERAVKRCSRGTELDTLLCRGFGGLRPPRRMYGCAQRFFFFPETLWTGDCFSHYFQSPEQALKRDLNEILAGKAENKVADQRQAEDGQSPQTPKPPKTLETREFPKLTRGTQTPQIRG